MNSNEAHELVLGDLQDLLATQEWRKTALLSSVLTPVLAGKIEAIEIPIENDADFHSFTMTGKIVPTNGATVTGLLVEIYDNQISLSDGFIPLECILSPGYGSQVFFPHKFEHIFARNNKIRLNVQNISLETQSVEFVFAGEKLK